MIIRISEGER